MRAGRLQHAVEGGRVCELLEVLSTKILPPFEKHRVADELEPGSELEFAVLEHLLELIGANVFRVTDFVRVHVKVNVGLDEKDVIDCKTGGKLVLVLRVHRDSETYSHVLPTCHRWEPYSVFSSRIRTSPAGSAQP